MSDRPTPKDFVNEILSQTDASNWDADLNKGDYFRGLRDAYTVIHAVAIEFQEAMYSATKEHAAMADALEPFAKIGLPLVRVGTVTIPDGVGAHYLKLDGLFAEDFRRAARVSPPKDAGE